MNLGERIRQARKEAGLTQKQLAEKIGVAAITIRQYESSKREPRYETLRSIAAAVECNVNWLFSGHSVDLGQQATDHVIRFLNLSSPRDRRLALIVSAHVENFFYNHFKDVGYSFDSEEKSFVQQFDKLNKKGKETALERISELTKISDYASN